jgi:VIT1/CCC1 family predicted Fe2+/Mn2+ transporter
MTRGRSRVPHLFLHPSRISFAERRGGICHAILGGWVVALSVSILMGKSRWRPEPYSLGVSLLSRDALLVTRGSSSGVSDLFDGI